MKKQNISIRNKENKCRGIKVMLITDLTKYNPKLSVGVTGKIRTAHTGVLCNCNYIDFDAFTYTREILDKGIEVIDIEYLSVIEARHLHILSRLETATDVALYEGPRGGFKDFSFNYINKAGVKCSEHVNLSEKNRYIEKFKELGIDIQCLIK